MSFFGKAPLVRAPRGFVWGINRHGRSTGVDTAVFVSDRLIENALGLMKIRVKQGKALSDFDPLMNSILLFRPQTTVQSFIKFDSKLRPQERWQTDTQTDASDLICPILCYNNWTEYNKTPKTEFSYCYNVPFCDDIVNTTQDNTMIQCWKRIQNGIFSRLARMHEHYQLVNHPNINMTILCYQDDLTLIFSFENVLLVLDIIAITTSYLLLFLYLNATPSKSIYTQPSSTTSLTLIRFNSVRPHNQTVTIPLQQMPTEND